MLHPRRMHRLTSQRPCHRTQMHQPSKKHHLLRAILRCCKQYCTIRPGRPCSSARNSGLNSCTTVAFAGSGRLPEVAPRSTFEAHTLRTGGKRGSQLSINVSVMPVVLPVPRAAPSAWRPSLRTKGLPVLMRKTVRFSSSSFSYVNFNSRLPRRRRLRSTALC